MRMRVAIVGSRDYLNESAVRAYVRALPPGTVVVSGGARGVDRWAASEAKECGLEVVEYLADWDRYGRRAGMIRNSLIVSDSDKVVAFWDGVSAGTANTIKSARRLGRELEVIR